MESLSDPTAGELSIGSSPALAEGIVLAVTERLSRQYPRLVFHVATGGAIELAAGLRERRLDLAFMRPSGLSVEEDLMSENLFEDRLVAVTGMQNRLLRHRKITLADLVNESWTWPSPYGFFGSQVVEAFRKSGIEAPRAVVYTNAINMRIGLAAAGRYLAIVPACVLKSPNMPASIKVLPVELPGTQEHVAIVTLKNRTLSPPAQLFIDCARETAKALAKRK
jgi:DNA-binding transcriptional LysR family regulator